MPAVKLQGMHVDSGVMTQTFIDDEGKEYKLYTKVDDSFEFEEKERDAVGQLIAEAHRLLTTAGEYMRENEQRFSEDIFDDLLGPLGDKIADYADAVKHGRSPR